MNKDEMKNKYTAFISEISEVLGLGKPVDIIKLCATTDLFFQPLEKRITELEQEVLEVRQHLDLTEREWAKDMSKMIHYKTQSTKANEIIREFVEWATWQGSNCPNFKSIQDKAEAFLNSEVEK